MNVRFHATSRNCIETKIVECLGSSPEWRDALPGQAENIKLLQVNGGSPLDARGRVAWPQEGRYAVLGYLETQGDTSDVREAKAVYYLGSMSHEGEEEKVIMIEWVGQFNAFGAGMSFHSAWLHRLKSFRVDCPWGIPFNIERVHTFGKAVEALVDSLEDKEFTVPRIFFRESQKAAIRKQEISVGKTFQMAFQNADTLLERLATMYAESVWPGGEKPETRQWDKLILQNNIGVMAFLSQFPGGPLR